MKKEKNPKNFLKPPEYPGGQEELKKFIKENRKYPKEALEKKIQGDVIIEYRIDPKGNVISTVFLKRLGHGCDEEAERLVKALKFKPQNNRNRKVGGKSKIKIPFKLKKIKKKMPKKPVTVPTVMLANHGPQNLKIVYHYTPAKKKDPKNQGPKKPLVNATKKTEQQPRNLVYKININRP